MAYCTTCGAQIKDTANFCKYCGTKVKTKSEKPSVSQSDNTSSFPPQNSLFNQSISQHQENSSPPVMKSIPEPVESNNSEQGVYFPSPESLAQPLDSQILIEPISEEMIDILYSRERDADIKLELKDLLKEIEKIEQRLEVGLTGSSETSNQMKEKQELIQALREERRSLRTDKLPLEESFEAFNEHQEKKQKLLEMYNQGKIERESVYQKLRAELDEKIDKSDKDLMKQKSSANSWLRFLEDEVHKLKDDAETILTRADLGELTHTDAQQHKDEIEIDIYRKELAYHSLKKVLDSVSIDNSK